MLIIIKWIFVGLLSVFGWLVTGYAVEYFRPYKRAKFRLRNKE
jgi:hypothetical protein